MDNQEIAEFFSNTQVNVLNNAALREPQREGYFSIRKHFCDSEDHCYVQLPVGCGKTGLMGLTPFGVAKGRVLVVTPNLQIRANVLKELNVSDPNCFYSKRNVFVPTTGPFISELKTGANTHDCDNAHIVAANIQQFAGVNNKWYEAFPKDYFALILVDEGHHNVADTWQRLFEYFSDARVASYTATPVRSDGKHAVGTRVYSFTYRRSMLLGFISPVDAVYVKPTNVTFTAKGEQRTLGLAEVLEMREHDWFSKGIALSEQCNRHIVQASISQVYEVKKYGSPRQIIAVACSIRHATQVAALYREYGLKAEVLHSNMKAEDRESVEASLRSGLLDAIVQVNILGEGFDLGTLSVAAVFRPYRSLTPYIQFVGRILRLADPLVPHSPGNRVYVVSHVGLNDERWWTDFTMFDDEDKQLFHDLLDDEDAEFGEGEERTRLTLRPFMRVLNETVDAYIKRAFLNEVDETMVSELMETIRSKGFDPIEFGLTEDVVRTRLEMASQAAQETPALNLLVQPQRRREALRPRVAQEARSIAHTVMTRLDLKAGGRELVPHFPGKGPSNSAILIALAGGLQNREMGIKARERDNATMQQLENAIEASPKIADSLTASVKRAIKG